MDLSKYKAKPNKTIREHTDDLLKNLDTLKNLNYIKDDKVYELTKIACEYHDYGKANTEFQKRIEKNTKFDEKTEVVHNVLSLYFIDKGIFQNDDYYKVGFAVLNHHNYCDNFKKIESGETKNLIKNLLTGFKVYPVTRSTTKRIRNIAEYKDTILIKGLLNKCDYSASGEIVIEYSGNFLIDGLDNLLLKWKINDKNSNWNNLQWYCKANTDNNIMIVAPTGMGKTEAALHWIGNSKGFFILPLKTAINSIYKRVKEDILENENIEKRLALLHSDTLSYYNNDTNNEMDIIDYYNQSKQLAMPLNISTLDQLFDFVFKYQGYELKLSTLSYSKVVIDEIQMYSPDLLAYLVYGIKKINKMGGKIAILTATLAPFVRDLLASGEDSIKFQEKVFTNDIKRHNLWVYDSEINSEIIYKEFIANNQNKKSNKILVVCNTIKKAQQIYKELLEKELKNINILHSKFIKCERAEKEQEILKFGKTEIVGEGIWISTQIVEASLDIDFDYLFTELSDISGLFQRLGRCNRKGIKSIDEPNCFVFLNIDNNLLTNGNKGFIDKKIYELSKEALRDVRGLLTEGEKIDIINKYLTTENINGSDYKRTYEEFKNWVEQLEPYQIDKKDVKLRNIISYDVIPIKIYEEHKEEIDGNSKNLLKSIDINLDKKDLEKAKLEKIKLKEEIKKYTVPVGIYDIYYKGNNIIVKKIQLSKNEFVNVVNCEYNEYGFIRSKNKNNIQEENFDNFL